MHAKKASVGIWNLVKCSALCVAFLACIFTPIASTFCAEESEIFQSEFVFNASDYLLLIRSSDGSDSYTYFPDSSGDIITYVDAPGSYITTAFFTSAADLASDYGILSIESFLIHIHFAVFEPYSDQDTVFDTISEAYALVNETRLDLSTVSHTITTISDQEYIVDLMFRPNYKDLLELLNGTNDYLEVRITWDPAYTYNNLPYYYSFVFDGSSARITYTKRDRDNQRVPLTPEEQSVLNGMNQSKDEMNAAGEEISDAVSDLENMVPDIGDPFENAPSVNTYVEGSQFFIQLFNYFYSNQMTNAFISFSLVMALVVFIMRR